MLQRKRVGLIAGALVALIMLAGVGTAAAAQRPDLYIVPGNAVFPEGIAYQQGSDNFFVSSSSDGTIYRGDLDRAELDPFLSAGGDGRTSATGMKVTDDGQLLVSGAGTGQIFVYDIATKALRARFNAGTPPATFINDVAIAPNGAAYFTDSFTPAIYRITPNRTGGWDFARWLDLSGTAIVYQDGFNLNGIVATSGGKYLITVQSNTGKLFRIGIADKTVAEIDLSGQTLPAGDGLVLRGSSLYVVQNANQISKVQLKNKFTSGAIISVTTDPSFSTTTTAAIAKGRLLVVNSQFAGPGTAPFTVSSTHVP
jgi:Cu-Zn family superoxide dismutase